MENRRARVLVVVGARPNFVKVAPLMRRLQMLDSQVEALLVHTGQHYDDRMSGSFFDQLRIPRPGVNLEVGSGSHGHQTSEIMRRFEPVVSEWKPDCVIVVGDVNSTVACALVATKLGVRVAHVEAGLRSGDRTMPEEINRLVTDTIANDLFVSEPSGIDNLRREGVSDDRMHLVGNLMIDSLFTFLPDARRTTVLQDLELVGPSTDRCRARPFALLTLHRPSNVDDPATLQALLKVLTELGREIPVVFPTHPRTLQRLERCSLSRDLHIGPPVEKLGVSVLPPLGYLEFVHLMSEAALVLTDSGGIQEETTALKVPCLTLRRNTERPITVDEGTNILVGGEPDRILPEAHAILAGRAKRGRVPALWDGRAADRIVAILLEQLKHAAVVAS